MKQGKTTRIATYGLLVALAFIFSYIETLIPFNFGVPGIKLGLANIVVMIALYKLGFKEAFSLAIIRVVLVGFTFGNMFSILYSLSGGILSCLMMAFLKKADRFSMIGVSVVGGVMHNVGQILMAMIMLDTIQLYYYLPVLIIAGILTGILIGILGANIVKRLPNL